jgi:hypothetical protein
MIKMVVIQKTKRMRTVIKIRRDVQTRGRGQGRIRRKGRIKWKGGGNNEETRMLRVQRKAALANSHSEHKMCIPLPLTLIALTFPLRAEHQCRFLARQTLSHEPSPKSAGGNHMGFP